MRNKTPRRKPKKGNILTRFFKKLILFVLMVTIFCASIVGGVFAVNTFLAPTPLEELSGQAQKDAAISRASENVHFLLLGSDEREDEPSRSDTMIYTIVRPVDKKIAYLSFPRDTLVSIKGYGEDKLNHSYAFGGLDLLTDTLTSNFNTKIEHTVKVNFKSFQKIIDAMGGITIDVEADMYVPWENIDLKKGTQKLDGAGALAYVRWRGDGLGDLGRIERQQKFMQAISEKLQKMWPWEAARTLWSIQSEIETDLSFKDMMLLGVRLIGIGKDDIKHYSLDVAPQTIAGISYVRYDSANVASVLREMEYGIKMEGE